MGAPRIAISARTFILHSRSFHQQAASEIRQSTISTGLIHRKMEAIKDMPQTALLAGIALVSCVFLALMSVFRRSPKDAPPTVSLGMPVFGNIAAFLSSPLRMIRNCYDT